MTEKTGTAGLLFGAPSVAYRDRPVLCLGCGYTMIHSAAVTDRGETSRGPREGDWALCGGCAKLHRDDGDAWQEPTDAEILAMDPELRVSIVFTTAQLMMHNALHPPACETEH